MSPLISSRKILFAFDKLYTYTNPRLATESEQATENCDMATHCSRTHKVPMYVRISDSNEDESNKMITDVGEITRDVRS